MFEQNRMRLFLIVLFSCVGASFQRSTPSDDSYVGAVVEYAFSANGSVNLQNYLNFIQDAAAQNADIIVFPELTLASDSSPHVPINGILTQYPVPAQYPELYDRYLVAISQAALTHQIYVVINLEETMDCTANETAQVEYCPEQRVYLFNTNVVFDRNGAIIDRFRKINLFGEFSRTPALRPELGIFATDFGVTFGHFICFDLMFQTPSLQVVQQHNITDVIFPTMWFSELPYLTAVQIQEAYAYNLNVNFLGAGANNVRIGSAGSGIYSGKAGPLASIMPGVPTSKLLVARVPKVPGAPVNATNPGPIAGPPSDADSLYLLQDPSIPSHASRLLVPGYQELTLTNNDVTCHFKVRMARRNGPVNYEYHALAFDGVRSFSGLASGGARVCGVVSCTGAEKTSCGARFTNYVANSTAIFEELTIEAHFPAPVWNETVYAMNVAYFPVSVDVTTLPLPVKDNSWDDVISNGVSRITYKLNNHEAELYSFAVWGRRYLTDGEEPTAAIDCCNGAAHNLSSVLLLPISLVVILYYLVGC